MRTLQDLGYIYNDEAMKELSKLLDVEKEDHVRWAMVIALGRFENPALVIPYLINKMNNDRFDFVRESAILGIGRIGKQVWDENDAILDMLVLKINEGSETECAYSPTLFHGLVEGAANIYTVTVSLVSALGAEKAPIPKRVRPLKCVQKAVKWLGQVLVNL